MNKKLLSTSFSLACHTIFLIIAFNLVFTPPSDSEPISPPILIHVHLDSRPFSPSIGNTYHNTPVQTKLTPAPNPMARKKRLKTTHAFKHRPLALNTPLPSHKPIVSSDHVISVIKPNVPALHAPAQPRSKKASLNTNEIFKDMKVDNHSMAPSSLVPVSDIDNQIEQTEMKPSLESEMQNSQGATPYLPFPENGAGTDIQSYLGYELYTYQDPSDHLKYFKLSIKVEEMPGTLVPLSKEITFLVDASNSIGNDVFQQFQKGVSESLETLGDRDKFNVVVFNDGIHKFNEQTVPNSTANVNRAEDFLNGFRVNSSTDIYDTVLKSIDSAHTMTPSYIFLISDGQPTTGITDSLQLINKIGEVDDGRVPIFGLGAGWANQYLMNFLTFTNHGWAEFVPLNDTAGSIVQLYDHIKDPVLTGIRYNSVGLDRKEIYPKMLPDLFKGAEFVLYGQYTRQSDFLFQLLGHAKDGVKQYIIKDSMTNARQGDRTIAEEWAMRKIIDLIGKLQYDQNNQTIIDEVNNLATKFNLKIPQYKAQ